MGCLLSYCFVLGLLFYLLFLLGGEGKCFFVDCGCHYLLVFFLDVYRLFYLLIFVCVCVCVCLLFVCVVLRFFFPGGRGCWIVWCVCCSCCCVVVVCLLCVLFVCVVLCYVHMYIVCVGMSCWLLFVCFVVVCVCCIASLDLVLLYVYVVLCLVLCLLLLLLLLGCVVLLFLVLFSFVVDVWIVALFWGEGGVVCLCVFFFVCLLCCL